VSACLKHPSRRKRDGNFASAGTAKRMFVMAFETPVTDAGKSKVHRIDQGLATSAFSGPGIAVEIGSFQKCVVPFIATMTLRGAAP
jgi:hypothetical protein